MNIDEIINILKKTKLLSNMSDSFLYALAFSADLESFSMGDVLVKSAETDIKSIIILEGRVFLQRKSNPVELKSGTVIGMKSLINHEVFKGPIIAGSKGKYLILSEALFGKLTEQFHTFPRHLLRYYQSQLNDHVEDFSSVIN